MKFIGNILWIIFGGLETAIGYFSGSIALMLTIVGIPFGLQTLKLGLLCLWPFGSKVEKDPDCGVLSGCLALPLNLIWLIFGGIWCFVSHLFWGVVLSFTIVGLPFGLQHFKLCTLALWPFGNKVTVGI